MRNTNFRRLVAMSLVLVILLSAFGAVSAQEGEKVLVTAHLGADDIPTLDPALNQDVSGYQVITEIFPAPARLHEETVTVEPGVATWVASEDFGTWTISVMPELPWVKYNADSGEVEQVFDADGNPRYVMAQDFATTMARVMDPRIASYYGGIAAPWFAGGMEWYQSDPEASDEERQAFVDALGIAVIDDYTLELTLPEGSPVFESILSLWFTAASPTWLIEEDPDFWTEPEIIVAYGPFAVKDWIHDESITIIKNPFWPGTDSIPVSNLDEVTMLFLEGSAGFAAYEAGEVGFVNPPGSVLDRVRADETLNAQLVTVPGTCTYYYGINQNHEILSNASLGRALSYAIDRQAIIDSILRGGQKPAGFFTLFNMVAAPQQDDYADWAMLFDADKAVAEMDAFMAETGLSAADVQFTLLHNTSETHAAIAQAIQQMWLDTLGISVEIASQEWATFLDTRSTADVYRSGWCFDYPDTNNWLRDVFHSANTPDNSYANPEFDALVEAAAAAGTVEERTELYAQAEQLLVQEDGAVIPIYYYTDNQMTSPSYEHPISIIGQEYFEKWDLVE